MGHTDSAAAFSKFYREMCDKADTIFKESNLCQWEKNPDGTASCIINRQNSKKMPSGYMETDGCCIELCKNPGDFNDPVLKKKQHNKKSGCLIKSLKCKLHICNGLILMSRYDPHIKKYIDELENMQKLFMDRYEKLWREIPYAASKSVYIKYFRILR